MKPRAVAILAACGIAALGAGWYFGTRTEPAGSAVMANGGLLFPDLATKLASVRQVQIRNQDTVLVIDKLPDGASADPSRASRGGADWGLAALRGYPVLESKLRALLTGLTELRLMEPRTSDPALFSRLGVEDPTSSGATSNLLTLLDASGKPVLSVIIGHRRVRSQGAGGEEVYIRLPDQNQTWLAQGGVSADHDAALWLDRNVISIPHDRIVAIDVNDHALTFGRQDGKLAVTTPAEPPKLEDYKVDDVGRALEMLTLQSVKPDGDVTAAEVGHAVFTTADGLTVTVRVFKDAGDAGGEPKFWARFAAAGADAVKAEAEALNKRLTGWAFEVGSWKAQSLVPRLEDVMARAEKPASSEPATAPAPAEAAPATPSPAPATPSAPSMAPGTAPNSTPVTK